MIWREKRILLIVLGLLLAANTIFFFTYRVQYESRLQSLDDRLEQVGAQLKEARRARIQAEGQLAGYRKVQSDVGTIVEQRWSTEPQRLTRLITEVKRMAVAAELSPAAMSYTRTEVKGARTSGSENTEVSISFNVSGTYQQIRRLINMLELTEQFVIIDSISLSSAQGDQLNLNLRLKTIFRGLDAGAERRL